MDTRKRTAHGRWEKRHSVSTSESAMHGHQEDDSELQERTGTAAAQVKVRAH